MKQIKKIYSNYDHEIHEKIYDIKHNEYADYLAQQSAKGEDNIWVALTDK